MSSRAVGSKKREQLALHRVHDAQVGAHSGKGAEM